MALPPDQRPFRRLATGCGTCWTRIQPAAPGADPSPGDRLLQLGGGGGPLADLSRTTLKGVVEALDWIAGALATLQPRLEQADAVLALAGLATALVDGAATAGAGVASLGKELVDENPGELLDRFLQDWPALYGGFRTFENEATILPPPEDIQSARDALARLLDKAPPPGTRSLRSFVPGGAP